MARPLVSRLVRLLLVTLCLTGPVTHRLSAQSQTLSADSMRLYQQLMSNPALVQELLSGENIVAEVGDQAILAVDLLHVINPALQEHEGKVPPDELDLQRVLAMKSLLNRKIEEKLIYLDFLRTAPPDKQKEMLESVTQQVSEQFHEQHVPKLMQKFEAASLRELVEKLEQVGSSLELQEAEFRDQAISQFMVMRHVDEEPVVTYDELLAAYQERAEKYERRAKARWEQLSALFKNHPTKADAEIAICEMGNQVLQGRPLSAVAKELSEGPASINGGVHDWVSKGSLKSDVLDQAIFSLPKNKLSCVLEDQQGFHIIRVLERVPAGRVPFTDAQAELREELQSAKRKQAIRDYIEQLRERTYVWTVFDELSDGVAARGLTRR